MTQQPEHVRTRRLALHEGDVERLRRMLEIRWCEDRIHELFAAGEVRGTTHLCQGQEAVGVAIAAVTDPDDHVTCTYRGHGVALALGLTLESVIGEVMGKETGCIGGLGGSMHLSDANVGLLPTFAIVGAGLPVAAGAALTAQYRDTDRVAVAVFGDGATNIGAFHEALNLAAIWSLPVVFVCENNLYGEYSPLDRTTPVADLAVRATSYAMPGEIVDGQVLPELMSTIGGAVERARSGGGPTLVEAKTYRFSGHSRADTGPYRPEGELDRWRERDPIELERARLVREGHLAEQDFDELVNDARTRVDEAIDRARAADESPAEAMFRFARA